MSIKEVYDYWNNRPCNIRHSTKSNDNVEFYDDVAIKRYKAEPHIKNFLELGKWKGKKVLELGSGLGTDAIQFAKSGALMTCIDLTENSIELCRKNFKLHNLNGEFYVGNIEDLDKILPNTYLESFDLIYSFGVIHHTPNPKNVIEQVKKYLKKDGEFRFMVYSKISYKLFWLMNTVNDWKFENIDKVVERNSEAQTGCPITYTYTFEDVKKLLGENYNINRIWKDHIFRYDIDLYKQNIFKDDKAFENIDEKFFNDLKEEVGWHTLCVATLR